MELKADAVDASSRHEFPPLGWLALILLVVPFTVGLAVTRGLSHDEHQHIASGMLWGKSGLLPYRDFPLFHTPYLTFVYGALFRFTEYPLLAARLFGGFCATVLVVLVGRTAFCAFRPRGLRHAWAAAVVAVGLCLGAHLFTHGAGRAWNLEPALLAAFGAFLALERGLSHGSRGFLVLAGGLLGLAIGLRITYAPLIAPLGLTTLLGPGPWQGRLRSAIAFSAGLLAGLAGLFVLGVMAPEAFLFGNFEFAQANIDYRMATGEPRTMTLAKKLRFLWKEVMRADAGLFLATLVPWIVVGWRAWRGRAPMPARLWRLLLAFPFLLWGAVAPSPVFPQYFFVLLPFLVLAGAWAITALPVESAARGWMERLAVLGVAMTVLGASREYEGLNHLLTPREWMPLEMHDEAAVLRGRVGSGRVLTLVPILPLEAGLEIDPAFSTGAFAWRVAPYVDPEKALRLGLLTRETLGAHLERQPADAVLVGYEKNGEQRLVDYAKSRGFVETKLDEDGRVWTTPVR